MADTLTTEDIAKLSVNDVKAILPSLSDTQLADLKKLETNDGENEGRVTLLAAIDAEQARRLAAASAGTALPAPVADPAHDADVPSGEEPGRWWKDKYDAAMVVIVQRDQQLTLIGEAIGSGAYDDLATGIVVLDKVPDLAIARIAAAHEFEEQATMLRAKLAAAESEKKLGVAPTGAPMANYRHVVLLGDTGFTLVLMDGSDEVDLSPIGTQASHFIQRSADTVIYDRPIALPSSAPPFRLTAIELRDDEDDLVDRCYVTPPMDAGGGRSVELPAGTLMFRQPARSAAEADRVKDTTERAKAAKV